MSKTGRPPLDLSKRPPFGRLTAVRPLRRRANGSVVWLCRCACGAWAEVPSRNLTSGNTKSCGCWRQQAMGLRSRAKPGCRSAQYLALREKGWATARIAAHFGVTRQTVNAACRRAAERRAVGTPAHGAGTPLPTTNWRTFSR